MKYVITASEQQARIMRHALEFYARAHMGQLHLSELCMDLDYEDEKEIENLLKSKLGLMSNSSFSIPSPRIGDNSRDAWDMVEVLRHQFWLDGDQKFTSSVDATAPFMNWSGNEYIEITKQEEK